MEMKLFSKWRPSAILSLRKLQFWSRGLYRHVILDFHSKFRVNWPIWRRDIAKNDFQYGVRPPSWICNISFFVKCPLWELQCTSACQIWSKSDYSRLRYFQNGGRPPSWFCENCSFVTWPISACDPSSLFRISRWSANMVPRYSQKSDFQYDVRPPSWICYEVIILHPKKAFYVPNFVLNFMAFRFVISEISCI